MAAALWRSAATAEWLDNLQKYTERVAGMRREGLEELDNWYHSLPATIAGRGEDAHITAAELVRTVEWKLKRGKWRPRLLDYAKEHSDDTVRDASREAFRLAADGEASSAAAALAPLVKLKGVGPATASAALAAAQPAFPFMSDEAAAAALGDGPLKYSVPEYQRLVDAAQAKAVELNAAADGGHVWTASDVERSLWSRVVADRPPGKKAPAGGRKRRAADAPQKKAIAAAKRGPGKQGSRTTA